MDPYTNLPTHATLKPTRYTVSVPDEKLSGLKQLLKLSAVGPETYENRQPDRRFGVTRDWLRHAKDYWLNTFDWRACEKSINSFPNYKVDVTHDDDDGGGTAQTVHFVALFSDRADAVPLILMHGWPGSFLEFLGVLTVLKDKYPPADLPYHVVVPSLPGWAFSSAPPKDRDFTSVDVARLMNRLMVGLGFGGSGYVAQGGDIGSFVAKVMVGTHHECKAAHFNFMILGGPMDEDRDPMKGVDEAEKKGLERGKKWVESGTSYASEQATRPATIGLTLSSSPLALLAWIGEKFLDWSDEDPPLDKILESVTLYWLTECSQTNIYTYREFNGRKVVGHSDPRYRNSKPIGFSWFPKELTPTPKAWAATTGNLVWHRQHDAGGHFAAMEKPQEFTEDVEDFVRTAWPMK